MKSDITLDSVGDISFKGKNYETPRDDTFASLSTIFESSDLAIANLESPLVLKGVAVPGKCSLRGDTGWATVLKDAGIRVLSLANNHMMDFGEEGLSSTIDALEKANLYYVGAGSDRDRACAPLLVHVHGLRIAFLARTSVIVSSPCYATDSDPGVAFFDIEESKTSIRSCREQADIVVLLIHWGLEEYAYPSPRQRVQALELIDAGADIILGHHPHVLQGIEKISDGLICYSLGNFVFDEFPWSFVDTHGLEREIVSKLSSDNHKGGIFTVKLSCAAKCVESYNFLPTFISPDGTVKVDNTLERKSQFDPLCSRLHWPMYSQLWQLYSMRQEWKLRFKPMLRGNLAWSKFSKLRFKHFTQLLNTVRRSAKITAGKSTNPYD